MATNAEHQAAYRRRRKTELERLKTRERLEERLLAELAISARERRQSNALIERLLTQVQEIRRIHGALERPQTPVINRRRPLGHD
jgi:hypothetical protein